ncbi:light-inducible protein CPRF2 [Ziziphus jujuba]|uniref:Light-inducible protein CPRF2 n=2 Tax=Ziziphus jujuba TaxID=326968 RepID=A0A6P4A990_ZIZJJ|nr:light-inducible protein CPRF2 [Ziziphus jujuba]KAH7520331.1 hypothetical protein FEM48_Zijuj08G0132700 [Ziziphus jujuba var. spinosa]
MLSAYPAILPSSDQILGNPFPAFDGGFTPWDFSEVFPPVDHEGSPKPVTSNSGSGDFQTTSSSPKAVVSGSGSDEPNRYHGKIKTTCCTDEPSNRPVSVVDERRRRRMISNRESARRSRMRKQKHLENLRSQVNRFRVENRELTNRLRFALYHFQRVHTDNIRLRSEYSMLQQKLSDIRQIMLFRQLQHFPASWPCNTVISE